jgi:hypothetical protein
MNEIRNCRRFCSDLGGVLHGVKLMGNPSCLPVSSLLAFFSLFLFSLLSTGAGESQAAFEGIVVDSRTAAMGDCWSASDHGVHPLAPVPPVRMNLSVSVCYCAPYGLPELEQKNVLLDLPSQANMFTLDLVERGGSLYKERILSASISRQAFASTRFMVSLDVFSMSVGGLGEARFFGLSTGFRSRPTRSLEASIGMGNLALMSASGPDRGAILPTFLLGLILTPGESVTAAGEVRKTPGDESSFHVGVELEPQEGIKIRCGLQTLPVELAMGFAIELGRLSIETASAFHPVLGRTDVVTLTFRSGAKTRGEADKTGSGAHDRRSKRTKEAAQ